jgi:sugar/nucleoside kinase (ribokinase family)
VSTEQQRKQKPVVCAGILVADLFVPPLPALPEAGQLLATEDFLLDSGGCAANTALCLSRLGLPATVIGRVGRDWFGDFVVDDLARNGIDTAGIKRSAASGTSKTVILTVTGQDRRYIHTIGANAELVADDLDVDVLQTASVFYLGGYLVLPGLPAPALAELLGRLRNRGVRTVLDVVAPQGERGTSMAELGLVLPFVDVFMPNVEESRALTGEREPERQAAAFLSAGCGAAIITMGPRGALLATQDSIFDAPSVDIDSVDESGAGDAFAAGFIAGMVEGRSLEDSLTLASVMGASACRRLGCHAGAFTSGEAEQYLGQLPAQSQARLRTAGPPARSAD